MHAVVRSTPRAATTRERKAFCFVPCNKSTYIDIIVHPGDARRDRVHTSSGLRSAWRLGGWRREHTTACGAPSVLPPPLAPAVAPSVPAVPLAAAVMATALTSAPNSKL